MEDTPRAKRWTRLPRSRRVSVERNRLDRTLWGCKEFEMEEEAENEGVEGSYKR